MAQGNWQTAIGGTGTAGAVTLTGAEYDALVLASGLTAGVTYYVSDGPAMWFATDGNSASGLTFEEGGVIYVGDEASAASTEVDLAAGTWATRPITGFDSGVMYYRRMTDIGGARGTVMGLLGGTDTDWKLLGPLRLRLRGAGSVTTSAQYPTNTRFAFPAGFAAAFSMFDVLMKLDQADETSVTAALRLKLGAAGDANDSTILVTTGNALAAGENQRTYSEFRFAIESSTTVRYEGLESANNAGSTGTAGTTASGGAVTLASSATTASALYLGLDYTMSTSNTAMTTSLIVTLYP